MRRLLIRWIISGRDRVVTQLRVPRIRHILQDRYGLSVYHKDLEAHSAFLGC